MVVNKFFRAIASYNIVCTCVIAKFSFKKLPSFLKLPLLTNSYYLVNNVELKIENMLEIIGIYRSSPGGGSMPTPTLDLSKWNPPKSWYRRPWRIKGQRERHTLCFLFLFCHLYLLPSDLPTF